MKKIILFPLFVVILNVLHAQPLTGQNLGKWDNQIYISDVNGRPVRSGYSEIAGFPFFNNEFKIGNIVLTNGKQFVGVPLRIDIVTHEVNFQSPNKEEGYLGGNVVKEVSYIDSRLQWNFS